MQTTWGHDAKAPEVSTIEQPNRGGQPYHDRKVAGSSIIRDKAALALFVAASVSGA